MRDGNDGIRTIVNLVLRYNSPNSEPQLRTFFAVEDMILGKENGTEYLTQAPRELYIKNIYLVNPSCIDEGQG
ncbi:MAG: hypothetical protein MUQ20_00550 [Deltaproteobacteria bacterium]|nr:hypothetical protein [Deltaproteobacteria bacterium]